MRIGTAGQSYASKQVGQFEVCQKQEGGTYSDCEHNRELINLLLKCLAESSQSQCSKHKSNVSQSYVEVTRNH